jgi:hypothetical protein
MSQADSGREAAPPQRSADHREAARALDDLVAETERLGLYDEDPEALREALKEARAERGRT